MLTVKVRQMQMEFLLPFVFKVYSFQTIDSKVVKLFIKILFSHVNKNAMVVKKNVMALKRIEACVYAYIHLGLSTFQV